MFFKHDEKENNEQCKEYYSEKKREHAHICLMKQK